MPSKEVEKTEITVKAIVEDAIPSPKLEFKIKRR